MWLLSQVIGREVRTKDGVGIGRLADLTVRLGDDTGPHMVQRLLVERDRAPSLLVPWVAVYRVRTTDVETCYGTEELTACKVTSGADALLADEIMLARDVLDTQIVDVVGQRLARVADVVLARAPGGRLNLVGVEVGFGGVLRRLGLRRQASRAGEDAVAWTDVHLTSDRGHAVQLAAPRSAVHHLDVRGLAALIATLDTESATEVLAAREPGVAAGAVGIVDPVVAERLLRAMEDDDAAEIVAAMPDAHAARWRTRLARAPALLERRLEHTRVWPRRRRHADRSTS
ncbi:magnesium transporter MgtE N-terminal domain-containing protein [Mycobacterium antarcticum]|uniref:magnesium transporter MgtE N-terminal domain-containing protein n=1 Tax=Mycolicibacterium sp. TUM20984 TaxID=3023368 RepID=UPI0024E06632|nr:magnesium transporter [Mycolicibacterium sp. TUM20984]